MPAITFSRRHYRFAFRFLCFSAVCTFLMILVLRKGDVVDSVNIEAPAVWLKENLAKIPMLKEDDRDFWQVLCVLFLNLLVN